MIRTSSLIETWRLKCIIASNKRVFPNPDRQFKKTDEFKNHSTYTVNRRVKISPLTWIQTNGELDKSKRARLENGTKNTLIAKREELRERRRGSNSRVKFPPASF